jgi:hypothetical protein
MRKFIFEPPAMDAQLVLKGGPRSEAITHKRSEIKLGKPKLR